VTNGARPLAPGGRHSSQVGTLLDRIVAAAADEVPDPEPPDDALPPVPAELDPPPPLGVDPVAELPDIAVCAAVGPVLALIVGKVTAP
jgi:hypothetical protein